MLYFFQKKHICAKKKKCKKCLLRQGTRLHESRGTERPWNVQEHRVCFFTWGMPTFTEPPEIDSEFYSLPNCILTPHIAGSAGNEVRRMGEYMRREYQNFLKNESCKYEVTLEMLKTMA